MLFLKPCYTFEIIIKWIIYSQELLLNTTTNSSRWLFLYSPPTQTLTLQHALRWKTEEVKKWKSPTEMERWTTFLYISITTAIIYTKKNGGLDKGGQYIFNSASVEFYVTRLAYKKKKYCYVVMIKGTQFLRFMWCSYVLWQRSK